MNCILPLNITADKYSLKQNNNTYNVSHKSKQTFQKLAVTTPSALLPISAYITTRTHQDSHSNENYTNRMQALAEKIKDTKLKSSYILQESKKVLILPNIKPTQKGIAYYEISDICPESLELLEQFVENKALYENENLCNGIMDKIIKDNTSKSYINTGKNNSMNHVERLKKVKLISDTYIANPDCQKSRPMQKNIGFMMLRAQNASDDILQKAVAMMQNPELFNNEDYVYKLTYQMKNAAVPNTRDTKLNTRLADAREQMDKIDAYRYTDVTIGQLGNDKEYEINGINLPIVEKFLSEDRLKNNELWQQGIVTVLSSINTMIYCGTGSIQDVNDKIKEANNAMNDFISDSTSDSDKDKAKKYIDSIRYY